MKTRKKKDRFLTSESTLTTLENAQAEQNNAAKETQPKGGKSNPKLGKERRFSVKKHPLQIGNIQESAGYFENHFTYVPGYSHRDDSKANSKKSSFTFKRSQSAGNLKKISRPKSALHNLSSQESYKLFTPGNYDKVQNILHPNFPKTLKMPKNCWIPGYRSHFKKLEKQMNKNPIIKGKKFTRDNTFRPCKFQYSEKDATEARSKPIIRCSSKYRDFRERQKIWIRGEHMERSAPENSKGGTFGNTKNRSLMTTIRKAQSSKALFKKRFRQTIADNKDISGQRRKYLHSQTKYRPVSSHKFRTLDKRKWVGKSSFKVF